MSDDATYSLDTTEVTDGMRHLAALAGIDPRDTDAVRAQHARASRGVAGVTDRIDAPRKARRRAT